MKDFKDKVRLFTQKVWRNKNYQVYEDMIHPDFSYHDPVSTEVTTKTEYMEFIKRIQATSPDMKYTILDIIGESNKVVSLYSWEGTPVIEVAGVPPSGKKLEHKGVAIYYFEDDKVVKIWDVWDRFSVLKQLGVIS